MAEALDAATVRRWSRLAADALGRTRAEIDAINVFPVADADTGTNLHLTMLAAADAVDDADETGGAQDAAAVWHALARGALLGARGNSGVILSQVLRGLAETLGTQSAGQRSDREPGGSSDQAAGLARALEHAAALARRAVEHPVEGTILSALAAARDSAWPEGRLGDVAQSAAEGARRALDRTTGQLDVLARSGVVDAGAAGLCVVLDTLAAVITGRFPERYEVPARIASAAPGRTAAEAGTATATKRTKGTMGTATGTMGTVGTAKGMAGTAGSAMGTAAGGSGYEVMYLLDATDAAVTRLRAALDGLGDSLVVVGGDGLWNVHVHVDDAGAAVEAGLAAGRPHRIRITYLHAAAEHAAPCGGRAVVAVAPTEGLAALLEGCGARAVTREPGSVPPPAVLAEAMLGAGDEVAVLPDGPAALAAAEDAAERARAGGVRVEVVPVRAAVQAIAALAVHDPYRRFAEDVISMTRAAGATRFGHLEIAAGEAVTSAGLCRRGDVLGMIEDDVAVIGTDPAAVAREVLDRMLSGGGELVTLIAGKAGEDGEAGAVGAVGAAGGGAEGGPSGISGLVAAAERFLQEGRPDVEVAVYGGGPGDRLLLIGVE